MKKKLKLILPLGIALILAAALLHFLLPRYLGRGEVVMTLFSRNSGGESSLTQVREGGTRQIKLGRTSTAPVFSPNERYMAVCTLDGHTSRTQVVELADPKKVLYTINERVTNVHITDEGLLIYYKADGLCCHDGTREYILDKDCYYVGHQVLGNTAYYFRLTDAGVHDLYACDLPDGTPRLLGEDIEPSSLQLTLHEGRHYVLAARNYILTGTAYEQVIDDAGEEMEEVRRALKEKEVSMGASDIYRWVDNERTVLAEGVLGNYRVEPISGTVVGKLASLVRPVKKLSQQKEAYVSEERIFYAITCGSVKELHRSTAIDPVITPQGEIYLLAAQTLLHDGEVLLDNVSSYRVLLDEQGKAEIYCIMMDRSLVRLADGEAQTLLAYTGGAYFPAIPLPGGANKKTAGCIFYERIADEQLRTPGPVMMSMVDIRTIKILTLCRWENGVETALINDRFTFGIQAMALDGQVLVEGSGGWFLVGNGRSDMIFPSTATVCYPDARQVIDLKYHSHTYSAETELS